MAESDPHFQPAPPTTRERIVMTAMRLFHEQGYSATGIATILREADVNSGSLYHLFPSKEALLVGVLEEYVKMLRPIVMEPQERETPGDGIERIFTLLAWYRMGMDVTGCRMGCPIGNLALELSDNHPEIRRLIDLNFRNWITEVRKWLESARERLPKGTDCGQVAQLVLTIMEGGIMQSRASGTLEAYDASVAQLRVYLELLQEKAGSPRSARRPRRKT